MIVIFFVSLETTFTINCVTKEKCKYTYESLRTSVLDQTSISTINKFHKAVITTSGYCISRLDALSGDK